MTACKECRYIVQTKEKVCPKCQGELSDKFSGMVIILDPERSEVAKLISVNVVGSYAVRVK
ncbi:DNA-directed RNA polymerase subunit E'' [Candidatus Micrarchaeota archaeon]|nr:DNA-directed RNA polymerase subunit E'' [Candidatus Micrarchaeota archaeon]